MLRYRKIGHPTSVNVEVDVDIDNNVLEVYVEWEIATGPCEIGRDGTNIEISLKDIDDLRGEQQRLKDATS